MQRVFSESKRTIDLGSGYALEIGKLTNRVANAASNQTFRIYRYGIKATKDGANISLDATEPLVRSAARAGEEFGNAVVAYGRIPLIALSETLKAANNQARRFQKKL